MPHAAVHPDGDLSGLSVCVVACHYKPETTGSAPYNTMLAGTLADSGATVEVIAGVPYYPHWSVRDRRYRVGLRWHESDGTTRLTRVRHAVPARPDLLGRARLESSFAALATPYVLRSRADVIVTVTPLLGALLAARLGKRDRPFGVIVHDLSGNGAQQSGTAGGRTARAVAAVEYRLLRAADKVGIITAGFSGALTSNGVDPERIVSLPIFTHIEGADLTPELARQRLGWPTTATTVVHTGNMGMKQGLEHVVDAARAADRSGMDVRFVFVGDGNQRAELEERARGLPNVQFVPPVSEETYPVVLAAADILLLHEKPGLTEMSLPSKLTSYVTARRPVLAAVEDSGITKALLNSHGAALTTPSGDVDAMLAAVQRLRADPALADDLVVGAAKMGSAEFSADLGRTAFRAFVRSLSG